MIQSTEAPPYISVPVWFRLPEGFTEIPLGGAPQERALGMGEMLEALYPEAPFDEKLTLVAASEFLVQGLLEDGAIHGSSFMYRLDDGQVCSGTAFAFMEEKNLRPLDTFAERTLMSVSEAYPGVPLDKGAIDLPCGPAVLVTQDVAGPSLASIVGAGQDAAPDVNRQLEVCIPFPHGLSLLKVCFATPDLEAWEGLFPVFGQFLSGISFTEPPKPKSEQDVERQQVADDWARHEFG